MTFTSNGYVYGWGSNSCGQTGVGKNLLTKFITIPTILKSLSNFKIKSIYCEADKSYGITSDGLVYCWGWNNYCQLGHDLEQRECVYDPKLINLTDIISVSPGKTTYFLSKQGTLYFCGALEPGSECQIFEKLPLPLETGMHFKSLHSYAYYQTMTTIHIAVIEDSVVRLIYGKIKETKHKNVFDYLSFECDITPCTIF